jgi:hypothetical protein
MLKHIIITCAPPNAKNGGHTAWKKNGSRYDKNPGYNIFQTATGYMPRGNVE